MKKKTKIEFAAKLKESEIRYRRLFETARDGIIILDSVTGQITDVNPFLEKLLGYSKGEFLEKKIWEVGVFKNVKSARDAFKILQKRGYLRYDNLPLETKDGRIVDVEFVSNSYMAGNTLVIQCNIRDVTERKKLELIKETKRLLQEERMKLESIADATHELRTPLAIIKGNVDLAMLGVGKNPKSAKNAFRAIDYEVKHLSGILSDLTLITSKAWELKNRIVYEKVSLKSLINICIARSIPLAYKKNIKISKKNVLDITIMGDKAYLEKMLVNLLKNSVIYGNNNGKTIITTSKSKGFVKIDVTDTGIGISKEDLPHVFERFYRADKVRNISVNSVGLGLAIVKWIADIHGGSVHVKNNKGAGSTFNVTLPIDKSSK